MSKDLKLITEIILKHYPATQAIYLFGSYGTDCEWPNSDVDVGLLFLPSSSKKIKHLAISDCRFELEKEFNKKFDLLNIRQISTVFQKEIIIADRRIYCADQCVADEFEMLMLSYYQKLNEERKDILNAFYKTGRAYSV